MDLAIAAILYFRFLLVGGAAYLLLRRFTPTLAKVVWSVAVAVQVLAIIVDLVT